MMIISYHGRPARWIIPFWQPAYPLHLYTHVFFSWQINSADAWAERSKPTSITTIQHDEFYQIYNNYSTHIIMKIC